MFEEIVRQYALEQVKSSFMLSNIGIFAFSNTRKENLPEYNKKLLKHLEDKEYSKIDCDFNSFCFIHTTKAALLYLKGQYSDVLSFCKKEEKEAQPTNPVECVQSLTQKHVAKRYMIGEKFLPLRHES